MKTINVLIAILFISFKLFSQSNPPVKQWAFNDKGKIYSGIGEDWLYTCMETTDGNYIGAGYTENANSPEYYNIAIVKLNKGGKRIWETSFHTGTTYQDYAIDMVENSSGNYVILAQIFDYPNGMKSFEILEYDKDGNLISQVPIKDSNNLLHGGGYGSLRKIISGGFQVGYIIGCADLAAVSSHSQADADPTLIRLDNNFQLVNSFGTGGIKTFNTTNHDSNCRTATVLHDSQGLLEGFLLVGRINNSSDYDALIIKTDVNGNQIWQKTISENYLSSLTNPYTDSYQVNPLCTNVCNIAPFPPCPEDGNNELGFSGEQTISGGDIIINMWFDHINVSGGLLGNCSNNNFVAQQSWLDMDVALLKIHDDATGTIVSYKDAAHFSGIDYFTPMKIGSDGFLYLGGNDASINDYINIRLLKIDPSNLSTLWDKIFISDESISYFDINSPIPNTNLYHENCVFGLDLTIDGGVLICGNNQANDEDYMMVKLTPDCQKNISYSSSDIVGGHTLTSNENWSTSRQVQGTINIPTGKTLTISGSSTEIKFADTWRTVDFDLLKSNSFNASSVDQPTKIIVEPGGKLVIDNSAVLRGMNACGFNDGDMWEGIEVWGNPSVNYQLTSNQGNLEIKNGAVIQDARCGILVDKGVYNINGNSAASNVFGGGIINSSNAYIKNCRFGFVFGPFISHYGSYLNHSKIISTSFECNAPLSDEIYRDVNGTRLGTNSFFKTYLAKGLHFQGCTFNGLSTLSPELRGTGIGAFDAGFTVEDNPNNANHCKFNNLNFGIVSGSSSGPGFNGPIIIENAEFGMDHTGNPKGSNFQSIYLIGSGLFTKIINNSILVPAINKAFGIELEGYTSFECLENKIFGDGIVNSVSNFGMIVSSSLNNDNILYRNTFNNLSHSSTALYTNGNATNGLQFKCNTYDSNGENDIEVVGQSILSTAQYPASVRLDQGECLPTFYPNYLSSPAGNTFLNSCNTSGYPKRIFLDQNALQVQTMNYHFNNSSGNFDPGIPSNNCITNGISTTNCFLSYHSGDNPCPNFTKACPTCLITAMQQADIQINNMKSLIDGANTDQMISYIHDPSVSSSMLSQILHSAGRYLSDDVLKAVMEEADRFANSELRDVIVENSPLSDSIYQNLLERNPIIAGNSEVVMAQLSDLSPRDVLELQIGQLQGEKRQSTMKLVDYYQTSDLVPDDDSASAILLAANYIVDAAGMKASMGDYSDAQTLLMSYVPKSQEELDEKKLAETYLSLLMSGNRWDALSSEQLEEVQLLSKGIGPASARAKTVLNILGIRDLEPQIPSYEQFNYRIAAPQKRKYTITNFYTFTDEASLTISPNPVNTESVINYRFPSASTHPLLIIRDFTGKQLISIKLSMSENTQTIDMSNFQQGVYTVQLLDNKSIIKSSSIVKIN